MKKNLTLVIISWGLALSWALLSCVSPVKPVAQDESSEPEQVAALVAEPVLETEDTAPAAPVSVEPASSTTSVAPASSAPATVSGAVLPGQYVIQRGDTFRVIAARPGIYWNETLWSNIYNANRSKITNPDLIMPGVMLVIPPLRDEIREGMWEANRYYENPFVTGANTTAPTVSAATRQTSAQTPTNSTLVRRNVVSCKIAGVERADQISYITLEWAGLSNANGVGTNVRIEAYTTNSMLVGTIVLENSHSYGRWNRYFSVTGEFLTAYNSWNDRIDFATIENNSIQIEHESISNVFLRIELDGSPFRN